MKKIKKMITSTATIFSGMIAGDFIMGTSNMWKIYLCVVLFLITLNMTFKDEF